MTQWDLNHSKGILKEPKSNRLATHHQSCERSPPAFQSPEAHPLYQTYVADVRLVWPTPSS